MGKEMKDDLNDEECDQILDVVRRDLDLRKQEKKRIEALEKELEQTKEKIKLLTTNSNFNNMCCLQCSSIFIPFFLPKITCHVCGFKFCIRCLPIDKSRSVNICSYCLRERAYMLQKNSWFYEEIRRKFGVHGGVKIIGNLFRNKPSSFKSDVLESDSGYMSKMSNCSQCLNSATDPGSIVPIFSNYKELFDSSLDKVREAVLRKSNNFGEDGNNSKYNETIAAQKSVLILLLSSLYQETKEKDINHGSGGKREATEVENIQIIKDFLMYAMAENKYQVYLFNINPVELKVDDYIENLSEAIINKTIDDLNVEETKEDLCNLSDKLTLAVLAKMTQDSMYFYEEDSKNNSGDFDDSQSNTHEDEVKMKYASKYADFDDDDVDLESLKSYTENKSKEVPLPLIELPLDYTKQLYGISGEDKIIGGRPISFIDPDLDTISMTSSNMAINEIGQDVESFDKVASENKWQLGGRGSLMMKKRIPYGVNDLYGTDRRDGDKSEDEEETLETSSENSDKQDLVMFLPDDDDKQINLTAENVKEVCVFPSRNDNTRSKQKSIDDPDVLEDTNLAMFRRKKSLDNERLKALSYTDDGHKSEEAPRFVREPEDISVGFEKPLKLECTVSGAFPIDVIWYRHSNNLVELNGLDERYVVWQRKSDFGLNVASVNYDDQGYYMCMASNSFGFCQKGFRVSVTKEENSIQTKQRNLNLETNINDDYRNNNVSESDFKFGTQEISEQINVGKDSLVKQKSSLSQRWVVDSKDQQNDAKLKSPENVLQHSRRITPDDVFLSDEGQNKDLNEKRIPTVGELRKRFIAENSLRDHIKHSSRSRESIKRQSHDSPDFRHSYVPLSPVPINRNLTTSGDINISHQSSLSNIEVKEQPTPIQVKLSLDSVQVYQNADSDREIYIIPGSLSNDKNKLAGYSNLNTGIRTRSSTSSHFLTDQPAHRVGSNNSNIQTPNTSLASRNIHSPQKLTGKSVFSDHNVYSKSGTFVSKVMIGEDCDIVSSYGNLPKTKYQ